MESALSTVIFASSFSDVGIRMLFCPKGPGKMTSITFSTSFRNFLEGKNFIAFLVTFAYKSWKLSHLAAGFSASRSFLILNWNKHLVVIVVRRIIGRHLLVLRLVMEGS